ncbi:MAG TPA: hypothetical protein VL551_29830 [Actinospica sp.]|nr:hypothetical protein [Actinospica sp.]
MALGPHEALRAVPVTNTRLPSLDTPKVLEALRRLRAEAGGDAGRVRELLQEFKRIGLVGAEIFCREAQSVWPELRPAFDRRTLDGAACNHLPRDLDRLAALVRATL